MDKEYYIKKWLEGTLTNDERKEFEGSVEYRSLEKLSRSVLNFKAPEYDMEQELERFHARKPAKGKQVTLNWFRPFMQVAAAVVLLIAGYLYFASNKNMVTETLAAEKTEVLLPDSSAVMLNAHSRLSYNKEKWEKNRKVELEGEAFFDVAKGSKFDVETSFGTVSVLGTEFNVMSRKGYFEVTCYEGLVQVASEREVVKLSPDHSFRIVEGKVSSEKTSRGAAPDWINGESTFNSVPFMHVVREFERQYGVAVVTKNVDLSQHFTGGFVHSDISLALKSIALPLNLTYEIKENQQVVLSGDID